MSEWYEPKKEDMSIDGDEINIWLFSNDSGNVYAAVKIKDIKELLKKYAENK